VDDFRNVDKEQLGILALKGVQELSSSVASLNGTCASLQAANALLQQENAQLKSQVTDLQAANAAASSQMAALMDWARAQGFSG
jgi:cell division protein FtsB